MPQPHNMEEEEYDFDITVEDDTPEKDRGRYVAPDDSSDDPDDTESEEEYSDRVRRRIAKETAKLHAERRAKESAVRERDEAVAFARQALETAQNLNRKSNQYEQGYVAKAYQAAEAQVEKASQDYADAMVEGDTRKMIEAQKALFRAENEKVQYENYVPPQEIPYQQYAQPAQQQANPNAAISPDELRRQTKFIQENPWLNTDAEMTERALAIDAHVRQTVPHLVGTDEYYEFVDTMMRQQFPEDRFGRNNSGTTPNRPNQAGVAPVNRGTGKNPRASVTLSESQIKLCKRLGITPQQYAAQLLKDKK